MKHRGRADHLFAWTKSPTWRAIASRRAKANLAEFAKRPRCGATCRSTGDPCRNPVIAGRTKCRLHGGSTGRGRYWHKLQPALSPEKVKRKIADQIRAAAKRSKHVARMTPAEIARHNQWQAAHIPDTPEARASRRELRRQNLEARKSIERLASAPPKPQSPEAVELVEQIARLKAELELSEQYRKGVFA